MSEYPEPLLEFAHPADPDPDAELARKNMLWGWALLGLFCVLFAGTAAVAFIYLWLS